MYSKAEPHSAKNLEEKQNLNATNKIKKKTIILQKSDVISLHLNSMKSH